MRDHGQQVVTTRYRLSDGQRLDRSDAVRETKQAVYELPDGSFEIDFLAGKRKVTPSADGGFERTQMIEAVRNDRPSLIRARLNASMLAHTEPVIEFDAGDRWLEIRDYDTACMAGLATATALATFYMTEEKIEGGHPRRWFVLVGPSDTDQVIGKAATCVLPDGVVPINGDLVSDCHTTGYDNANPYPTYEQEIEELASVTGLPIIPNYLGGPLPETTAERTPRL